MEALWGAVRGAALPAGRGEGGWIAYRAAQAPTPQTETYLSQAGLYTVGTEENLLVLVLDSVDADQFAQALAEDPDLSRRLEGFTWYRNAMGLSDPTKYGLPALLTGQAYTQPVDYAPWNRSLKNIRNMKLPD